MNHIRLSIFSCIFFISNTLSVFIHDEFDTTSEIIKSPSSPCPDIFQYKLRNGNYYADLILPVDRGSNTVFIELVMTLRTTKKAYVTFKSTQTVENIANVMKNGGNLFFNVSFTQFNPVARLKKIIINDNEICVNSDDIALTLRTVEYKMTFTRANPVRSTNTNQTPFGDTFKCGVPGINDNRNDPSGIIDVTRSPWLANLVDANKNKLMCMGYVLSDEFILTVSQCIVGQIKMWVIVGLNDPNILVKSPNGFIRRLVAHGQIMRNNDVAVLKVSTFKFSNKIAPICLPNQDYDVGKRGLRLEYKKCIDDKYKIYYSNVINGDCRLSTNGDKYFCTEADSSRCINDITGVGLIQRNRNNVYYLYGITQGNRGGLEYVNIVNHITWIYRAIENLKLID